MQAETSDARAARTLPLTLGQRRLWALAQRHAGDPAYHHLSALRLSGPLDETALAVCLRQAVSRHDSLRMRFPAVDGQPVARIEPHAELPWQRHDLSALGEAARQEALARCAHQETRRPFDLERGPLMRASLFALAPGSAVLLLCLHHMVMDGWSLGVLIEDIAAAYVAYTSGRPAAPSSAVSRIDDYVADALDAARQPAYLASLAYWKNHLDGLQWTRLPADADPARPRPQLRRGRTLRRRFDGVMASLDASARALRVTRYQLLVAAFLRFLACRTGKRDLAIVTLLANRHERQRQRLVGYLANTVVVRHRCAADDTVASFVADVSATLRDLLRHGQVSLYSIAHEAPQAVAEPPSILFSLQNTPLPPLQLGEVEMATLDLETGIAKFDLSVYLAEAGDGIDLWIEYDTGLYREAGIEQFAAGFRSMLVQLCEALEQPALPVDRLLPEGIPLGMLEGPRLAAREAPSLLQSLRDQAARRPDAIALETQDGTHFSFARMEAGIRAVTAALDRLGARPGERVAVLGERNHATLCAIWACLARGLSYVPLAPDLPPARLRLILDDAAAHWQLADGPVQDLPGEWRDLSSWLREARPIALDDFEPAPLSPELPAYLLYTSGSTGGPKGVLVSRGSLEAFCGAMDRIVPRTRAQEQEVWLAVSSLSFDISMLELLWSMSRGFHVRIGSLAALCEAPADEAYDAAGALPALGLFYFGSTEHYEPQDHLALLRQTAQWADRQGFDTLWTPERHFTAFGGFFSNPALTAMHLAGLTQRIAIRAGSAIGPLQHTLRLAEDWAAVSRLSNGRAGLSLATGWNPADFILAHRPLAQRADTVAGQLRDLRALWRGEAVPFHDPDGRYFEARIPLPPQAAIPLSMTVSNRPEQFEAAAEQGVDVLTHLLEQDIEQLARNVERYRHRWQALHGEDAPRGRVTLMLHTHVDTDDARAAAVALPLLVRYLDGARDALRSLAPAIEAPTQEALLDGAARRLVADRSLICGPRTARERLRRLHRLGVDEVACLIDFGLPADTVAASLERLAAARDAGSSTDAAGAAATHLQCTPSAARLLLQQDGRLPRALERLAFWAVGGEALDDGLLRRMRMASDAQIANLYGPTEATIWATACGVPARRSGPSGIGTPLAGVRVHLLDEMLRPVPRGVEAQLYIGGVGVAQGYWRRPAQTAAAFVPDPFGAPGARLYATGDRARVDASGRLVFMGRQDAQVKINGYRVELAAMREALARHPAVADAQVLVCGTRTPDAAPAIVAFVVPRGAADDRLAEALQAHLALQWEVGTLPRDIVCIPELPLTASQKVDLRRLEEIHLETRAPTSTLPRPAPAAHDALHALWREAMPGFDGLADFHRSGGNSLIALQLLARANAHFGAEVTLRDFYSAPTLAGHRRAILAGGPGAQGTALVRVARTASFPVSSAQRAMLILDGRGEARAYHDHVALDIEGPLSAEVLRQAFEALVRRHRIFTTAYRFDEGDYLQVWREDLAPDFRVAAVDGASPEQALRAFADEPFDLLNGRVVRALLLRTGEQTHCLCLVIHHIASDGATLRLVLVELLRDYGRILAGSAAEPAEAPWQYVDFSDWQARHLAARRDELAAFWAAQTERCRAATDVGAAATSAPPAGHLRVAIGAEPARVVDLLSARHRAGEFSVLVAALCLAMEDAGTDRLVTIATDARNRERPEFEQVPGMMVNQLLLPMRLPERGDAGALVQSFQRQLTDAFSHQAYPYEWLVAQWRQAMGTHLAPHFDAKFVLNDARTPLESLHGLAIGERVLAPSAAKFGLLINLQRDADGFSGSVAFDPLRHSERAVRALWDDFLAVLARLAQMDDIQLERQALAARRAASRSENSEGGGAALLAQLQKARRRPAGPSEAAVRFVAADAHCPVPRIEPCRPHATLADSALEARAELVAQLQRHGAVLARGFAGVSAEELSRLAIGLCGELVGYTERSTPRTRLGEKLYTATEHPAHQRIELHNENAYAHQWPGTLFFWCAAPAASGGENLLADSRAVLARLPWALRERFAERGVLYRRELGPPLGMPWQYVFQCERPEEVDSICRAAGYDVTWHSQTRLSLSRVAAAIATHPVTQEASWFNHALFFHESSLEGAVRASIRDLYGDGYLPNRSFHGDGSPIGEDEIAALRAAYAHCERRLLLEKDDVLMVDNLLMAHGRCAFEGPRDIRLMMGRTIGSPAQASHEPRRFPTT
ncbi:MupA/Atu3671 family FMN-dependent luciferase-like monooxygenase [Variovorax boronicumulans]|uniref:MupA/Atu3671 family FMN-dependent luciferase-like monooxygenase n=1 Tax=Variovorax boronicumulans TaxID=436515 RepID=UPI003395B034